MLTELCAEIRNYFTSKENIRTGEFTISGGVIAPSDFLKDGQYFRIVGSTFNDGVWQHPAIGLIDETFTGDVWAMAVPPSVIALSQEIDEFKSKTEEGGWDLFQSQSFGGYSGTVKNDANWRKQYAGELAKWRKI